MTKEDLHPYTKLDLVFLAEEPAFLGGDHGTKVSMANRGLRSQAARNKDSYPVKFDAVARAIEMPESIDNVREEAMSAIENTLGTARYSDKQKENARAYMVGAANIMLLAREAGVDDNRLEMLQDIQKIALEVDKVSKIDKDFKTQAGDIMFDMLHNKGTTKDFDQNYAEKLNELQKTLAARKLSYEQKIDYKKAKLDNPVKTKNPFKHLAMLVTKAKAHIVIHGLKKDQKKVIKASETIQKAQVNKSIRNKKSQSKGM